MTYDLLLAHHPIVTALPFFVPALIVVALVGGIVWRDRHSEEPSEQDRP